MQSTYQTQAMHQGVNKLAHPDTVPHRGLQLPVGGLGWVQSGRGLGHRSWQVGIVSHKCHCSESHCRPGMEEPSTCEVICLCGSWCLAAMQQSTTLVTQVHHDLFQSHTHSHHDTVD